MAIVIPVFPTLRPFTFFDESAKFRSQVDRLWTEMQQQVFSNWPVHVQVEEQRKSEATEQQKETKSEAKEEESNKCSRVAEKEQPSKSMVVAEDGSFQLTLPVSSFKPEELTVKVVNDSLLIEAHHEEKDEKTGSFSQRHLQQRFILPKSCDKEALTSSLSADGLLTVTAPRKSIEAPPAERKIEIQTEGNSIPCKL